KELQNDDLKLWGDLGYWKDPNFKKLTKKNFVEVPEINKIYNLSKINLNYHLTITVRGTNLRTFDIPASGAFLLTDYCSDIVDRLFEEGTEVITYKDFKEMKDKAGYYLQNEKERLEIAGNARQKVLKKHLYKHRIAELLDIIKAGK
ncbi:MAG: glycosyltransferase family 1 protein, partial [bacterium]|nr:glycosyltransferase family 1 protein [bacterium]